MIALVDQHVKTCLRGDENIVLPIGQLQRKPFRAAAVGKFGRVYAIGLSVKKRVGQRECFWAMRYFQGKRFPFAGIAYVFEITR